MVKKVIKDNNVLLNEGIFFKSVFLLDKNRVEIGVLETKVALNLAYKEKLDLLCINPKSNPPVCQIIDYNKYLYQKKIKSKSPDKKQNIVKNKEISFRINISNHDLEIKANKVKVFLRKG
jgi:translation initiation factor IF-3